MRPNADASNRVQTLTVTFTYTHGRMARREYRRPAGGGSGHSPQAAPPTVTVSRLPSRRSARSIVAALVA